MRDNKTKICILSDQEIRAVTIKDQITGSPDNSYDVKIHKSDNPDCSEPDKDNVIYIVDLMTINKPAKMIIETIKKIDKRSKIIALHIYKSSILINPLFDMGIKGYVFYEPSREELLSAISNVADGKNYLPVF